MDKTKVILAVALGVALLFGALGVAGVTDMTEQNYEMPGDSVGGSGG